jgi:hypothetical protein
MTVYLYINRPTRLSGRGHMENIGQEDSEQDNPRSEVHGFTRAGQIRHNPGVRSAGILALVGEMKEAHDVRPK